MQLKQLIMWSLIGLMPSVLYASDKIKLDIAAQPLEQAIHQLEQKLGKAIAFDKNLAKDKKIAALQGEYTVQEALDC